MSYYNAGNELMRYARTSGVIDTTPLAIQKLRWGTANLYKSLMNSVTEQAQDTLVNSPWLGKQSSWRLPQTRRYKQSRGPSINAVVQSNPGVDWMVELARYPVPFGSVGIIKSFEQYLSQGETIHSVSSSWGDPFPTVSVRWFLRLSPMSRVAVAWIDVSGASAIVDYLPGTPYEDLSDTNGLWFPAGSSSAANIHLVIPGDSVLRLIALVSSSSQDAVNIAAKLTGSTQIEVNDDAQFMMRTSW